MSVSYYSKGGAPQSLLTPKSWITPKKGSEKAGFTGGCASLQLGSLMQQVLFVFLKGGKRNKERSTYDRLHLPSQGVTTLTRCRLQEPQSVPFCTSISSKATCISTEDTRACFPGRKRREAQLPMQTALTWLGRTGKNGKAGRGKMEGWFPD